jgi:hypothetical protein
MRSFFGCKNGEEVYYFLTNPTTFFRFNEIVDIINHKIMEYTGYTILPQEHRSDFGGYVTGVGSLSTPMPQSKETLERFKSRWDEIYNEDEVN